MTPRTAPGFPYVITGVTAVMRDTRYMSLEWALGLLTLDCKSFGSTNCEEAATCHRNRESGQDVQESVREIMF